MISLQKAAVDGINRQYDSSMDLQIIRLQFLGRTDFQALLDIVVMPVYPLHDIYKNRNADQHDPCTVQKFTCCDNYTRNSGDHHTGSVDECLMLPLIFLSFHPPYKHSRL